MIAVGARGHCFVECGSVYIPEPPARKSILGILVALTCAVKGDSHFHPTDEDLFVGTRDRKKPVECVHSVYTNSQDALAFSWVSSAPLLQWLPAEAPGEPGLSAAVPCLGTHPRGFLHS